MKTRKLFRYIHSFLTTSENENMDAQSLKRLRRISLVLLGLEAAVFFWFVLSGIGRDKPLHFLAPAIVALISGTVLYRNQVLASVGAVRMEEDNRALRDVSRHDALTGLLNRMALEADACRMLGRNLTVYMIDINYFKEVNDQYGHAAGDALLRETGEILKHLYPDGHYYRYGGDEFLVLTHRPAHENYGAETYDLRHSTCGVRMLLSIGGHSHDLFRPVRADLPRGQGVVHSQETDALRRIRRPRAPQQRSAVQRCVFSWGSPPH